ncbi:MAG: porin [Bacteroidota bacterium]
MIAPYFFPLYRRLLLFLGIALLALPLGGQDVKPKVDHSYRPLSLKLSEDGTKYIRFITWHQIWATSQNLADGAADFKVTPSIRRSRFLAFAQCSPRFLILTHWGLNGLSAGNMDPLGNRSDAPQLFLHGAWTEFMVDPALFIGAGLHYWKGMNRLANSSTLNFMTMDHTRPFLGWHSLGYTDQFARHMGVYFKGVVGKLDYRVAFNDPIRNGFASEQVPGLNTVAYNSLNAEDSRGDFVAEGYIRYNFWDMESVKLPYAVGTYLGKKKVFNIGVGFFSQPNGSISLMDDSSLLFHDVFHFSLDAFLDYPVGGQGDALTAYATYMNFDYGPNWTGLWSGTGDAVYGHVGYYFSKAKIQPYVAFQRRNFESYRDTDREAGTSLNAGINYFINGHHAKLTLEYHGITPGGDRPAEGTDRTSQIRFQAHVFL